RRRAGSSQPASCRRTRPSRATSGASRSGAERVDLAVGRADVDAAVGNGGGRVEGAVRAEARLARGAPDLPAGARAERVDVAVIGADEEPVPREGDAALHLVTRLEAPADAARPLVEGVDLAAPVAHVDPSVRDERRRLGRADPLRPARLAVSNLEGGDEAVEPGAGLVARAAVHEAREDGAPVDVGRGGGATVRDVHPRAAAGAGAEREEAPGVVRDVQTAVADG